MGGARGVVECNDSLYVATINNVIAKGGFEEDFEVVTRVSLCSYILTVFILSRK